MRAAQDLSYSITCNWTASFLSIFLLLLTGKYPFYQFFYPVQISVSEVFFFLGSSESKVGLLSIYLFLVVIKASLARVRSISILSSLQSSSCLTDRFISISYSLWSSPDLDFWPCHLPTTTIVQSVVQSRFLAVASRQDEGEMYSRSRFIPLVYLLT